MCVNSWIVVVLKKDNKTKVPCGNTVPMYSSVYANNTGMTAIGDEEGLNAPDHNFHVANITQLVILLSNIPSDLAGSFFVGDRHMLL